MLPRTIVQDAWWMDEDATDIGRDNARPPASDKHVLGTGQHPVIQLALMAGMLTVAADYLVFDYGLGLGLVLCITVMFCAALVVRMWSSSCQTPSNLDLQRAGALVAMAIAPVLEYAQALSVGFLILSLLLAVLVLNGGTASLLHRFWLTLGRWFILFAADTPALVRQTAQAAQSSGNWRASLPSLFLPVAATAIFAMLFTSANPVLQGLAEKIDLSDIMPDIGIGRVLFWILCLFLVWPLLRRKPANVKTSLQVGTTDSPNTLVSLFLTPSAVLQTLIVSNIMFMVQGLTDIGYLFGGAELPDGLTYAQYAHKGAYPLLATALLAGGFAIATARLSLSHPVIRALTIFWMIQTLALVGTSVFRLSLYIDVYGMTLLRIWAAIWMGLVSIGIVSILLQIAQGRTRVWLVQINGSLGIITLYLCCFFNFTDYVTRYNFAHLAPNEAGLYACRLGAQAAPAYLQSGVTTKYDGCITQHLVQPDFNWREWSLRKAHLQNTLTTIKGQVKPELSDSLNWRYGALVDDQGY